MEVQMSATGEEVSTIRVSGWIKDGSWRVAD
jgi:hypothetical protein